MKSNEEKVKRKMKRNEDLCSLRKSVDFVISVIYGKCEGGYELIKRRKEGRNAKRQERKYHAVQK